MLILSLLVSIIKSIDMISGNTGLRVLLHKVIEGAPFYFIALITGSFYTYLYNYLIPPESN